MATKNYVSKDNLETFLTQLKAKYADNDLTGNYKVAYAGRANADVDGNVISSTYLKSADQVVKAVTTGDELKLTNGTLSLDVSAYLKSADEVVKSVDTTGILGLSAAGALSADMSAYDTAEVAAGKYVAKNGTDRLMTAAEGTKLAGIAEGAEVNVIDTIVVKDEAIVSLSGKTATIDLDAYAKKSDITAVLRFKGTKATKAELPADAKVGDVWIVTGEVVESDNAEYVCVAESPVSWEKLGNTVSLDGYYTKSEVDNLIDGVEGLIDAEETRATGAEGALAGRLDVIEGTGAGSIKKAADDAEANAKAYADGLNTTMDGRVDALEADTHTHSNKAELDLIASGDKAKWDAKYDKPSTGIPSTDMASAVQSSLALADSAVQPAAIADMETKTHAAATYVAKDGFIEFTQAEKTKLAGIEAEAEKNIIEAVKVNGTALEVASADRSVNVLIATGANNGNISVNGSDVAVKGLGSAAFTPSTDYATAAQGALADTALQPDDLVPYTAGEIESIF